MISWEPLQERHAKGTCERGVLWLRLDKAGNVTALYTIFGEKIKYVPQSEHELDPDIMKLRAEYILDNELLVERLTTLNNHTP